MSWNGTRFCSATGKKCYPSAQFAKRHARHVGNRLRAYRCEACGQYHLANMDKRGRMMGD